MNRWSRSRGVGRSCSGDRPGGWRRSGGFGSPPGRGSRVRRCRGERGRRWVARPGAGRDDGLIQRDAESVEALATEIVLIVGDADSVSAAVGEEVADAELRISVEDGSGDGADPLTRRRRSASRNGIAVRRVKGGRAVGVSGEVVRTFSVDRHAVAIIVEGGPVEGVAVVGALDGGGAGGGEGAGPSVGVVGVAFDELAGGVGEADDAAEDVVEVVEDGGAGRDGGAPKPPDAPPWVTRATGSGNP